MGSPFDAFRIDSANNHILYTVYLYYFGNGNSWLKYHLLSVIAGTASVALLGWLGFQISAFAGISALIFSALSIPLIVASSEARGYALAIFFAIAAFALFKNYGKKLRLIWIMLFWLSIILGLLAHLVFVYIYAAFWITSVFIQHDRASSRSKFKEFLLWHTVPSLFALSLFFLFVKNLDYDTGDSFTPGIERFASFMLTALNLPYGYILSIGASIIIFIALLRWIIVVEKRQSKEWIFYGIVVGVVPIAAFLGAVHYFNPGFLSFSLPFIYLLLASMLSRFSIGGQSQFAIAIAAVVIFVAFSISGIQRQLEFGPGHYLDAFQYAVDNSRDREVTISSDQDYRYSTLLGFYEPFIKTNKNLVYISNQDEFPPEWLLIENRDPDYAPLPTVGWISDGRFVYDLKRSFQNASIYQGWTTYVYQRHAKIIYVPI
jgi:hypothetical protein